jgi:phytoene synthase
MVQRCDPDRFATVIFAPPDRREALFALYAFNLEIARVPEIVSAPILGQIRLQWWRDMIEAQYEGRKLPHPVAGILGRAIGEYDLSPDLFDRLLMARERDLTLAPLADLTALEAYVEDTAAALAFLALAILGSRDDESREAARHVALGWGLTGLLRAVPFHAASGRLYLPLDLLARHGLSPDAVMAGKRSPGLCEVARQLAHKAMDHLRQGRRLAFSPCAVPALLTARLADGYLTALAKSGFDPLNRSWSVARPRPMALLWSRVSGRI